MSDGVRTHGRWSHNPELYQLSYAHHAFFDPAQNHALTRSVALSPGLRTDKMIAFSACCPHLNFREYRAHVALL